MADRQESHPMKQSGGGHLARLLVGRQAAAGVDQGADDLLGTR